MATSREQRGTDTPAPEWDEAESGRPAPIDEDVEGELNAALPEPEKENEARPKLS